MPGRPAAPRPNRQAPLPTTSETSCGIRHELPCEMYWIPSVGSSSERQRERMIAGPLYCTLGRTSTGGSIADARLTASTGMKRHGVFDPDKDEFAHASHELHVGGVRVKRQFDARLP